MRPAKESLRNEAIPKSAARVLNAQNIRDDYRKKRKSEDGRGREEFSNKRRKQLRGQKPEKSHLVIQAGESLGHFNRYVQTRAHHFSCSLHRRRRVEDDLRPLVKSAMQLARAMERKTARQEREARAAPSKGKNTTARRYDNADESKNPHKKDGSPVPSPSPKDFATALPKRLNDVAQAPPEFKKLPRGTSSVSSAKRAILPMSQRLLMEQERRRVIQRYRELRARDTKKDQD